MDSSHLPRAGYYWYFAQPLARTAPELVEIVQIAGSYFARFDGELELLSVEEMRGDFAGPFPSPRCGCEARQKRRSLGHDRDAHRVERSRY
jgi:hypothetical protein